MPRIYASNNDPYDFCQGNLRLVITPDHQTRQGLRGAARQNLAATLPLADHRCLDLARAWLQERLS